MSPRIAAQAHCVSLARLALAGALLALPASRGFELAWMQFRLGGLSGGFRGRSFALSRQIWRRASRLFRPSPFARFRRGRFVGFQGCGLRGGGCVGSLREEMLLVLLLLLLYIFRLVRHTFELSDVHAKGVAFFQYALAASFDKIVESLRKLSHTLAQFVEAEVD